MRGGIPGIASRGGDKRATRDDEMDVEVLLQGLTPSVHDHREADVATEVLPPEFLQQLSSDIDEEIEEELLIESDQVIENVVDGENDMEIMDGQDPFLLVFEPLRLFECPTLGTVAILSGLIVKLPILAYVTHLYNPAECGSAAIQNCTHGFGLLIGKPMRLFILTNMIAEDVSQIVFHP